MPLKENNTEIIFPSLKDTKFQKKKVVDKYLFSF